MGTPISSTTVSMKRTARTLVVFICASCLCIHGGNAVQAEAGRPPSRPKVRFLGANFLRLASRQALGEIAGIGTEILLRKLGIQCDLCDQLSLFYNIKTGCFVWCKHCGRKAGEAHVVIGDDPPRIKWVTLKLAHGRSYRKKSDLANSVVVDIWVNKHCVRRNYVVPTFEWLEIEIAEWCRPGMNVVWVTDTDRSYTWKDFREWWYVFNECQVLVATNHGNYEYKADLTTRRYNADDSRLLRYATKNVQVVGNFYKNNLRGDLGFRFGYVADNVYPYTTDPPPTSDGWLHIHLGAEGANYHPRGKKDWLFVAPFEIR